MTYIDKDDIYTLCNKYEWFTCGSIEQYEKLFNWFDIHPYITDIALIIYICSDKPYDLILARLTEYNNWKGEMIKQANEE